VASSFSPFFYSRTTYPYIVFKYQRLKSVYGTVVSDTTLGTDTFTCTFYMCVTEEETNIVKYALQPN
jgi:hypothetical protein